MSSISLWLLPQVPTLSSCSDHPQGCTFHLLSYFLLMCFITATEKNLEKWLFLFFHISLCPFDITTRRTLGHKCHQKESTAGVNCLWHSIAVDISEFSSSCHLGLRISRENRKNRHCKIHSQTLLQCFQSISGETDRTPEISEIAQQGKKWHLICTGASGPFS